MSKATTEHRPDEPGQRPWSPGVELAPSIMREDEPTFARVVGLTGAVLVIFAGVALIIAAAKGVPGQFGYGWLAFILSGGVLGLMYHAAFDSDLQVRRLYWGLAILAVLVGVGFIIGVAGAIAFAVGAAGLLIPAEAIPKPALRILSRLVGLIAFGALALVGQLTFTVNAGFFGVGFSLLGASLIFLLTFLKHESDPRFRDWTLKGIAFLGAATAVFGLLGGNVAPSVGAPPGVDFLLPYGALLALLGLVYLASFVVVEGTASEVGYGVGRALGVVGLVVLLVVAGRALPALFYKWEWLTKRPDSYLVPGGLILMLLGITYLLVSLGLSSESKLVVLTRRELSAFFYSPIAHIVFLGQTLVGAFMFLLFVERLASPEQTNFEPILRNYFWGIAPIFSVIFIVPVLTMRLFAEEQRSGTMEVLLTAPVEEGAVVMSKFWASFLMFCLVWLPWALYIVGLRLIVGKEFDYQVMFAFGLTIMGTGAGFISMGLCFSSLTRNQIAAAMLTFAGMLFLTLISFLGWHLQGTSPKSVWVEVITHMSYLDMWYEAFNGYWIPRKLLFWVSFCIFWLFVTVKVLESRKWR